MPRKFRAEVDDEQLDTVAQLGARASLRLLERLQHFHPEHDVPRVDDIIVSKNSLRNMIDARLHS